MGKNRATHATVVLFCSWMLLFSGGSPASSNILDAERESPRSAFAARSTAPRLSEPPVEPTTLRTVIAPSLENRVLFDSTLIYHQLPVLDLNALLLTSIAAQDMRGANKVGVEYRIDGVNITDFFAPSSRGSQGYSMIKREITAPSSLTGRFEDNSILSPGGRNIGMVQTLLAVPTGLVQQVQAIAGTVPAEYPAPGGLIDIASRNGGSMLSARIHARSSLGGLKHAGPDVYDAKSSDALAGQSAAEAYLRYKASMMAGDAGSQAEAAYMTWEPGKYSYGEEPRLDAEFTLGGPLTSRGDFFFSASLLNDHGRFPGEFQRQIEGSLKLNYRLTPSDQLTAMGMLQDGGKLGGWYNRYYTYSYQFFLEGQPVNQNLAYLGYLKHRHTFDARTVLENTISLVGNQRTYGFAPKNGKLLYDDYGDEFLIIDSAEKAEHYLIDPDRIFHPFGSGGSRFFELPTFGNLGRYGKAAYSYENYETRSLSLNTNLSSQVDRHHQIKTGLEYTSTSIDVLTHNLSAGWMPAPFQFVMNDYTVHPWNLGAFVQDRIEYESLIATVGLRFDGYSMDTRSVKDLFNPGLWDTTAYGMAFLAQNLGDKSDARFFFSPRLAVSHPIGENSAMHYSWGITTTPPNKAYWLQDYGVLSNISLPQIRDANPQPEKSIAYEIGLTASLGREIGADLTAYYRDNRNTQVLTYEISGFRGQPFGRSNFYLNSGYRDSRGLELTLWKRPSPDRLFSIVDLSGTLSAAYAIDSPAASALSLVEDEPFRTDLVAGTEDELFDPDLRFIFPFLTRSYPDWNAKLTLLFDFPLDFRLSTVTTYRSPWRYSKTIGVTNSRYEEKIDGDIFLQTDLRLSKTFAIDKFRAGFFFEAFNVFDRLNILAYETYISNKLYETDGNPWGPLNRPCNNFGIPYAGIARELYAGFEVSF